MRGRKPVPRALKILRGNPGKRRIADDAPEPSRAIDLAVPDVFADDPDVRAEWLDKAPMLHRLGLLTEADRDVLILYCAAFGRWRLATRELQKHGPILLARRSKFPMLSPYLIVANKAHAQCVRLMAELGMTPSARARVHVTTGPPRNPGRDRFFGPRRPPQPA